MKLARTLACALAASLALAAPVLAAPSEHADFKECGDQRGAGAGWYDARAQHVSCRDARAVARKYWNSGDTPEHVRVDGVTYHCRDEPIAEEASRVRCNAADERRVRFKVGA